MIASIVKLRPGSPWLKLLARRESSVNRTLKILVIMLVSFGITASLYLGHLGKRVSTLAAQVSKIKAERDDLQRKLDASFQPKDWSDLRSELANGKYAVTAVTMPYFSVGMVYRVAVIQHYFSAGEYNAGEVYLQPIMVYADTMPLDATQPFVGQLCSPRENVCRASNPPPHLTR